MNIPEQLLSESSQLLSGIGFVSLLIYAIKTAKWKSIFAKENIQQHIWFIATIILIFIWNIKTGIKPALSFHLLGATILTLMFEWQLASISLIFVIISSIFIGNLGFKSLPMNALLLSFLPCLLSYLIYKISDKFLHNNVFTYIFVNGFLGSAVTLYAVGISITFFLGTTTAYSFQYLTEEYLPYYMLMGWSEAFLTGISITLMVVYKPLWISTFDDNRYLKAVSDD